MGHKLRTSREVYDQVRWDPRLDARRIVMGYESRRDGMQEIACPDFVPGGDIPWHRIWYFRDDKQVLWDRRQRIDRLVGPGALPAASAEPLAIPPEGPHAGEETHGIPLSPLSVHRFDARGQKWVPLSGPVPDREPPAALTVVTYNVLFNLHDAARFDTPERRGALLRQLKRANADLIALQEVTPSLLAEVLAQGWVRERYVASDSPEAETVTPYGLLLLSRVPLVKLAQHRFTRDKRVLVGELDTAGGRLAVAVVHLMSDLAEGGAELRLRQLDVLLDGILGPASQQGTPDWLILGDFNFGDDGPVERIAQAHMVDVWRALRPSEPGYTFDPARNPLAAQQSASGLSRRLDRILLRSSRSTWDARDIMLLGEQAPASDHYGLRCTLALREASAPTREAPRREDKRERARQVAPVHRSAVVLIPPEALWPPIQRLRTVHDKHAGRWMPHVTLLYGFVPEEHFEAAAALAAEALASFEPFTVRFERLDLFRHRGSCTLWARPDSRPHARLNALQAALQSAFPRCDEQSRHSEAGFTPHLSLGQTEVRGAAETLAAWQRDWSPLEFEVREVQLISRRGDGPFEVRYTVTLGGGWRKQEQAVKAEGLLPWLETHATPTAVERTTRDEAVDSVDAACSEVLGTPAGDGSTVYLLGSSALGVALPGSDIDLLCVGPAELSRERFFEDVTRALSNAGVLTRSRAVLDTRNPVLKLELGSTEVDLQYARLPPGVPLAAPGEVGTELLARLDPESQRAMLGHREVSALLARVRDGVGEEPFRQVLRAVRAWARARGLDANALGFPGGFAWALLTAHACVHAPKEVGAEPSALLEHVFSTYARWRWPEPVVLTEDAASYQPQRRDVMPVPTLLAPVSNSARNVSRSTLAVLREEWARGETRTRRARSGAGTWAELFEPIDALTQFERFLLIEVRAGTEDALAHCLGWLEGHVTGLVVALEADPALRVRPFPDFWRPRGVEQPVRGLLLGLGGSTSATLDAVAERFTHAFTSWDSRPEGSALTVSVEAREALAKRLEPAR
jgi:poly(A) polymerase